MLIGYGLRLLEALEQPHRSDRVRAASLTSFFGHTALSLDAGGDREIEIGVPSREGRKEILQIHTRSMPLATDFDIDWMVDNSHGFVFPLPEGATRFPPGDPRAKGPPA